MSEIEQQIEEMYGALLGAFTSARQFDTPLHTETIKDMARYLAQKGFGKQNPWIPVSERMPEDDLTPGDKRVQIKVIVCNIYNGQKSVRTLARQYSSYWWRMNDGKCEIRSRWEWSKNVPDRDITHWMPLIEPPEVEHDPN